MCPNRHGDQASPAAAVPWIKADLPYSAAWAAQAPASTRAALEEFSSTQSQLRQAVATASARLTEIESTREQLRRIEQYRRNILLSVRTTRSVACTATGEEVCQSFDAVLGTKVEPVLLEERCTDKATAKRASNFNVPMFNW
jgi:hypothetical protein